MEHLRINGCNYYLAPLMTDVIIWESILTENTSFGGVRLRFSMLCFLVIYLFLVVVFVLLFVLLLLVLLLFVCYVFFVSLFCFCFSNRVFTNACVLICPTLDCAFSQTWNACSFTHPIRSVNIQSVICF